MKKLLFLCLCLTLSVLAEYQVFNFSTTIKHVEPVYITGGTKIVSSTLKGYLVSVCCYPCGASFGKGYPTWLYVIRRNDPEKILWKIPVKVDGGLFGHYLNPLTLEDIWYDYHYSNELKKYTKKGNKSWVQLEYTSTNAVEITLTSKKITKTPRTVQYGPLGNGCGTLIVQCSGFGSGNVKTNTRIYEWVNPYLASVSGSVTGTSVYPEFSFDPSNLRAYDIAPITGSFTIRFNNSMTEEIRGTADWSVIDRRIYRHLKYKSIVEQESDDSLWLED